MDTEYKEKIERLNKLFAQLREKDERMSALMLFQMSEAARTVSKGRAPNLKPFEDITCDALAGIKAQDIAKKIQLEKASLQTLVGSSQELNAKIEEKKKELNALLEDFAAEPKKKNLAERLMEHVSPCLQRVRNFFSFGQDRNYSEKFSNFEKDIEGLVNANERVGSEILDRMLTSMNNVVNGEVPSYTSFDSIAQTLEEQRQEKIQGQIDQVKSELTSLMATLDQTKREIQQKQDTLQKLFEEAGKNEKHKKRAGNLLSFVAKKITSVMQTMFKNQEERLRDDFVKNTFFAEDFTYVANVLHADKEDLPFVLERNAFILECLYAGNPGQSYECQALQEILKKAASALPAGQVDDILAKAHVEALSLKHPEMAQGRWSDIAAKALQMKETPFSFLRYIKPDNMTNELYMTAFSRSDAILEVKNPTQQLCDMAVMGNVGGFYNLPEEFRRGSENTNEYKIALAASMPEPAPA